MSDLPDWGSTILGSTGLGIYRIGIYRIDGSPIRSRPKPSEAVRSRPKPLKIRGVGGEALKICQNPGLEFSDARLEIPPDWVLGRGGRIRKSVGLPDWGCQIGSRLASTTQPKRIEDWLALLDWLRIGYAF